MSENLSEEEIKKRIELMKENCIFCKIIKKEFDSKIVFEDDLVTAILDISPVSVGHLLLMPKEHYMMMPMVPNEILGHLAVISKYLSDLLKQTFNAKNVTIYMANGAAAGQQSQHFMVHLIPRYDGDNIDFGLQGGDNSKLSENELKELVQKLKKNLNNFSG